MALDEPAFVGGEAGGGRHATRKREDKEKPIRQKFDTQK